MHQSYYDRYRDSNELLDTAVPVAALTLVFTAHDPDKDQDMWDDISHKEEYLRERIRKAALHHLGSHYEVVEIRIERGSVEVWVLIQASLKIALALYGGIAIYHDFQFSLIALKADLCRVFGRVWEGGPPYQVQTREEMMIPPPVERLQNNAPSTFTVIPWAYILLTHAGLLGLVVWMLLRK